VRILILGGTGEARDLAGGRKKTFTRLRAATAATVIRSGWAGAHADRGFLRP
jgi:hypothetical protein